MGNPIADQIAAEYRLAALPPLEPGEWRFIAADGRPVRVFDITGRPARTQLAHLPPPADRCVRCGRYGTEDNPLFAAWMRAWVTPGCPPTPGAMYCAPCYRAYIAYRPRVIHEYYRTIAAPVLCEVR